MSVKAILVLCAQALLIQSAVSQCISRGNYGAGLSGYGWEAPALIAPAPALSGSGLAYGAGLGYGAGHGYGASQGYAGQGWAIEAIPTSGGALPTSSVSAIAPSGLSIASENVFEGALSVAGELPFVSAVALDGMLPSAGAGAVSYSCGNGVTAIESIAPSAAAYGSAAAGIAPAAAGYASGLGYGGLAARGCGCGLY